MKRLYSKPFKLFFAYSAAPDAGFPYTSATSSFILSITNEDIFEISAMIEGHPDNVSPNIFGGMTLTEPAADLALCASIASSFRNRPIPTNCAIMGEIGLAGEIRAVPQIDRRIAECARLGFDTVVVPKANLRGMRNLPQNVEPRGVDTIAEAMAYFGLLTD